MDLTIRLPEGTEELLRQQASAAGKDVESFAKELIESRLGALRTQNGSRSDDESFESRLNTIADMMPVLDNFIDDSRGSIYEGRGE
ncbi:MAG: hypothetical protein AB8G99_12205 [Planctomycetaceae bacterium]